MGQSSGWLMSRNSITPARASATAGVLVKTSITTASGLSLGAGGTVVVQLVASLGWPLISTRHMRQVATGVSAGW